jgi:hypothetical protein
VRRLFGGPRVPPEVLERAGLARGEKVLSAAATDDGRWLLGTRDTFVVVEPPERGADVLRIAWERVESADWDRDQDRLRLTEVADFGCVQPVHVFAVPQASQLLQLVRERVTASVLLQRRVRVGDRRGLTVIARRPPYGGGEVTWVFELDPGVDPDDPAVREAADQALRLAQDELRPI